MKNTRGSVLFLLLGTACLACSKKSDEQAATAAPPPAPAPVPAPATPPAPKVPEYGAAAAAAGMSGTLTIEPDPVEVCEQTGLGVATLTFAATGTEAVEIRVTSPDGALLSMAQASKGTAKTGEWVGQGTTFYLQNIAGDAPRNLDHTLAKLVVQRTVKKPCK